MIITKLKDFSEIKEMLLGQKKVFIVGCGSCAAACRTGGEDQVKEMAMDLKKAGFSILGWSVPDETCHIPLTRKELNKQKKFREADSILVMSCGSGLQSLKDITDIDLYPACDGLFLGNVKRLGDFIEYCSLCGECILDRTAGFCPVTRCPKEMLNGPCGGMNDGKCEVDSNNDCVWVLIYERLKSCNNLSDMVEFIPAKDFSKKKKPQSRKVNR